MDEILCLMYLIAGFIVGVVSASIFPWRCLFGFHRYSYYRVFREEKLIGILAVCDDCDRKEWIISVEGRIE
ncbi:MAG: hypothetical protein J7J61_01755 [Candidatus Hydrothermae bacterium]|nr:hypothetical protein [Candidatus Hydrothermae bacterium]